MKVYGKGKQNPARFHYPEVASHRLVCLIKQVFYADRDHFKMEAKWAIHCRSALKTNR